MSEGRRRKANIPTSWQKLTQAQMYLTNSGFCARLNVSQMVVNSEAWRAALLCVEAIYKEH